MKFVFSVVKNMLQIFYSFVIPIKMILFPCFMLELFHNICLPLNSSELYIIMLFHAIRISQLNRIPSPCSN